MNKQTKNKSGIQIKIKKQQLQEQQNQAQVVWSIIKAS